MKSLYIHVGLPKTGTTSLQLLCREWNGRNGFQYIQSGKDNLIQSRAFANMVGLGQDALGSDDRDAYLDQLIGEIDASTADHIAISDETLSRIDRVQKERMLRFLNRLPADVTVQVVMVVRPFFEWCESLINQAVKTGNFKFGEFDPATIESIIDYNINFNKIHAFYHRLLGQSDVEEARRSIRALPYSSDLRLVAKDMLNLDTPLEADAPQANRSPASFKSLERHFEINSLDPSKLPEDKGLSFLDAELIDALFENNIAWMRGFAKKTGVGIEAINDRPAFISKVKPIGYIRYMQSAFAGADTV